METSEERKEREAALCREALEALGGVVIKPRPTGYYWVQQWLRWPWEGWRPPEIALWVYSSWRFAGSEDVRLSYVLIERARTKTSGQRLCLAGA